MLYNYLNFFIVIFGCVVTSACMLGPINLLGKLRYESKSIQLILGINFIYFVAVGFEALFQGQAGTTANIIMNVSNFLQYFLLYLLSNLVTFYLGYRIKENGLTRFDVRPFLYIYIIPYGLLLVNLYNKMYYYIGSDNMYYRNTLFPLSQIIGILPQIMGIYMFFRYRKYVDGMTKALMIPFFVTPLIVAVAQLMTKGINMMVIGNTISCLIIAMSGLSFWNSYFYQHTHELEQLRVTMKFGKIDPDFLYDTLEDITILCRKDAKEASRIMDCLADYLRKSMNDKERTGIEVFEQEFEHLKNFMDIEKVRYGERLQVEYLIEVTDFELPTRVLQQLAECFMRYIVRPSDEMFIFTLATYRTDKGCYIEMFNGNDESSSGDRVQKQAEIHDIDDIRTRLRMMAGTHLDYECTKERGTRYRIFVPEVEE